MVVNSLDNTSVPKSRIIHDVLNKLSKSKIFNKNFQADFVSIDWELFHQREHINITLFKSTEVLCGIDNILQNIPHVSCWMWGIFYKILSIPHITYVDLYNAMRESTVKLPITNESSQYLDVEVGREIVTPMHWRYMPRWRVGMKML